MLTVRRYSLLRLFCRTKRTLAVPRQTLLDKSKFPHDLPTRCDRPIAQNETDLPPAGILLASIKNLLKLEPNANNIEGYIHKSLDRTLPKVESHLEVYEAVIELLINRMLAQPAATVYERMLKKGFIPTNTIDAQMMAVVIADGHRPADHALARIEHVVSDPKYTNDQLLALLKVMDDFNMPKKIVLNILENFIASRGEEDTHPEILDALMTAIVQGGSLEQLFDVLEQDSGSSQLSVILEALQGSQRWESDALVRLGARLARIVANPNYKEEDVILVLEAMTKFDMDSDAIATVAESFMANRSPQYAPDPMLVKAVVQVFVQAGKVDEAFDLLDKVGNRNHYRCAHVTFLTTIRENRPEDNQSVAKLLSAMDKDDIPADTSMFNALISREIRLGRMATALAMYSQMKEADLPPDPSTFASLFAMYRQIRPRTMKKHAELDVVPLRHIFKDLMQCTQRTENRILPSTHLLNNALRAFMRHRDYVGSIIVLRSFGKYCHSVDHRTYYSVVKLLIRRVWAEVQGSRKHDEVRWADRFLGVDNPRDIELSEDMVLGIFSAVTERKFDVGLPLYNPKQHPRLPLGGGGGNAEFENTPKYAFPTMEMMESVEKPEPLDFRYKPVPLIRLLSRAALAELGVDIRTLDAQAKVDELIRDAEDATL